MERYNIKNVEKKWQNIWYTKKTNAAVLDKNKTEVSIPVENNIEVDNNSLSKEVLDESNEKSVVASPGTE